MTAPRFQVRVTKDSLVFSAAHFITFNGNICERLHGHNWRVAVEVDGALDDNRYVFDFIALRDALGHIVAELDHRMLLPLHHPQILVTVGERDVEARFEDRRWVFPIDDCRLLPVANTTAECLAEWIGRQLRQNLAAHPGAKGLERLRVDVEENFGQWARCELDWRSDD